MLCFALDSSNREAEEKDHGWIPSVLLVMSGSESALAKEVPPVSWSETTSGGVGSWRRDELVEL